MNGMRRIRCAEIFGGNTLADTDVCTRGLTASVFSVASEGERGGDVYYFSVCSSDLLTRIAVLDMRGHGKQVSHLSEWLYKSLEDHMNSLDGASVLSDLNVQIHSHGFEAITTAAVLSYYVGDSNLYFSYAGHPPALVRRSAAGWITLPIADTKAPANLPLGVLRNAHFDQQALALQPGDRFAVYTDGVVECPDPAGRLFGEDRLAEDLEAHPDLPIQELKQAIASSLRLWGGDSLVHDDCTFMIAEVAEPQVKEYHPGQEVFMTRSG
jgi:phosphoserine phosphatase RsbU/P